MAKYSLYTSKEIKPQGWTLDQLKIQAQGLAGQLDRVWPDVRDSMWIGGDREGWERVPYWLDGFIPLAYLLDDEDGSIYVGEINTIPGSLAFYLWEPVGIPFDAMIDKMVEYAIRAQADKKQSVFSYTSAILERGGAKK